MARAKACYDETAAALLTEHVLSFLES